MGLFWKPNIQRMEQQRDINGLMEALQSKDQDTRRLALQALGNLRDTRSLPVIIYLLEDAELRRDAMRALGQLRDPRSVEFLLPFTAPQFSDDHPALVAALGEIGDPRGLPFILMQNNHPSPTLRILSMHALQHYTGEAVRTVAERRLLDENQSVVYAAARQLSRLGFQPQEDEAGAVYLACQGRWQDCARLGKPALRPMLWATASPNPQVRLLAAQTLGEIGDPLAANALIRLLDDKDLSVFLAAVASLGIICCTRALSPMLAGAARLARQPGWNTEAEAIIIENLAVLGQTDLNCLAPHRENRLVLQALTAIGSRPAAEQLLQATKDMIAACSPQRTPAFMQWVYTTANQALNPQTAQPGSAAPESFSLRSALQKLRNSHETE
jgi:HEAT repeat protein